jgi:hypothetical protein
VSISTKNVLRRILDDVRAVPMHLAPPVVARLESDRLGEIEGERLWLFECANAQGRPYASSLHFWANALMEVLIARDARDCFDAVAGHCLCTPVDDAAAADALRGRASGLVEWDGPFDRTYRMLDQPTFSSYVGESSHRLRAFFWEDPAWLRTPH